MDMDSYDGERFCCPSCGSEENIYVEVIEDVIERRWGEAPVYQVDSDGYMEHCDYVEDWNDYEVQDSYDTEYGDMHCYDCGWMGRYLEPVKNDECEEGDRVVRTRFGNRVREEVA